MHPTRGPRPILPLTFAFLFLIVTQACASQDAAPAPSGEPSASPAAVPSVAGETASGEAFVPPETEAGKVLLAAMKEASATDRLLFVHSGADW